MNELINDNEMNMLARQLLAKYKEKLASLNVPASGKLTSTADYHIEVLGDKISVYFDLEEYWKHVEYGRKAGGKFPPPDKILEWIRVKPIIPRAGKDGKVPTTKQLAFLISRKIVMKGIEPKNALHNTIKENEASLITAMQARIAELYNQEFVNIIDTLI